MATATEQDQPGPAGTDPAPTVVEATPAPVIMGSGADDAVPVATDESPESAGDVVPVATDETAAAAEFADLVARVADGDERLAALDRRLAAADERIESLTARLAETADQGRAAVTALQEDVTELRDTARRSAADTAVRIAREVERHTTAALLDDRQRLHQASVALAGLAQSLADAARGIPAELTAAAAGALLETFAVDVDLLLQQLGHEPLRVAPGDAFDPRLHRAVLRVPTADPAADRTVARVVRDGYRTPATDRVLLFADVEVHRAAPSTEEAAAGRKAADR